MRLSKGKIDVVVLDDLQLVRIKIGGELVAADLEGCSSACSNPNVQSYNSLYDFRNCILRARIFDLYNFPRISPLIQAGDRKTVKVALLTNQDESYKKMKFYEMTSMNSGFNSKVFTSEEEAIAWLTNHDFSQSATGFGYLSEEEGCHLSQ
jgi:hypothetical protein